MTLGRESQAKFEIRRENLSKELISGEPYVEKRKLPEIQCVFLLASAFNLTMAIIDRNVSLWLSIFRDMYKFRVC